MFRNFFAGINQKESQNLDCLKSNNLPSRMADDNITKSCLKNVGDDYTLNTPLIEVNSAFLRNFLDLLKILRSGDSLVRRNIRGISEQRKTTKGMKYGILKYLRMPMIG